MLAKKANDNIGENAKAAEGKEDTLNRKRKRVVKVKTIQ